MKPIAVLALALAVGVATYAASAWSAPSATPTEQKLLKDVKTLKAQVAKLQKTDQAQNNAINIIGNLGGIAAASSICSTAITADAIQGTWQIVDQIAAATQAGKTYFGAQTPISDAASGLLRVPACQALKVTRSQALPPTAAQFSALTDFFKAYELRKGFRLDR